MARVFVMFALIASVLLIANSQPIRGEWKTSMIANIITTDINLKISDRVIRVNYNTSLTYNFTLDGNNIKTQFYSSTNSYNINKKPSQNDLKNAIASFSKYQLSGDTLKIKNSNGNYVAVLKRVGNVDPEPVAVSYVPPIVVTPVVVPVPPVVVTPVCIPTPAKTQDAGLLKNVWSVRTIKGFSVVFDVSISCNTISFIYCNPQTLSFSINNNKISITPQYTTLYSCPNLYPLEPDVLSSFASCDNYEVNDYFLYLKKGNEVVIFMQKV